MDVMEVNGAGAGAGILDFVQRFQQLQIQRDISADLIKARRVLSCSSYPTPASSRRPLPLHLPSPQPRQKLIVVTHLF